MRRAPKALEPCNHERMTKMKTGLPLLVAVCLLVPFPLVDCAKTTLGKTPSIYYKEVPAGIMAGIESGVTEITGARPLTAEARDSVRTKIKGIVQKGRYRNIGENVAQLREIGNGALPVVADLLTSSDDAIRSNALFALAAFVAPPGKPLSKQYLDQIEPILVALCQRSLLDRNVQVRGLALSRLDLIGHRHYRQIPEGVIAGVEQALDDPDGGIRRGAQDVKVHLGLAPRGPFDPQF